MTGRVMFACTHDGCRSTISVEIDDGIDGAVDPQSELQTLARYARTGRAPVADGLMAAATAMGWACGAATGALCNAHAPSPVN